MRGFQGRLVPTFAEATADAAGTPSPTIGASSRVRQFTLHPVGVHLACALYDYLWLKAQTRWVLTDNADHEWDQGILTSLVKRLGAAEEN